MEVRRKDRSHREFDSRKEFGRQFPTMPSKASE